LIQVLQLLVESEFCTDAFFLLFYRVALSATLSPYFALHSFPIPLPCFDLCFMDLAELASGQCLANTHSMLFPAVSLTCSYGAAFVQQCLSGTLQLLHSPDIPLSLHTCSARLSLRCVAIFLPFWTLWWIVVARIDREVCAHKVR
jgi:hypothetical protein